VTAITYCANVIRYDRSANCDDGRKDSSPVGKCIWVEPIHHSILAQQVGQLRNIRPDPPR